MVMFVMFRIFIRDLRESVDHTSFCVVVPARSVRRRNAVRRNYGRCSNKNGKLRETVPF